jgi:peptidoglycan/LPS O-acetylase OafA/YrhL
MLLDNNCINNYLLQLDGLRALSIILFLFLDTHFQLGKRGAIGADVFFVLSFFYNK